MRAPFAAIRAIHLRVALSIAALLLVSSSVHAQSLFGCNNAGDLFILNTVTGAGTHFCNLPTYPDPGANEIEYNNVDGSAFLQARDGVFSGQMFSLYSCGAMGPLVNTGSLSFNGLEYVGSVLYGTGIPNPCAASQLAIIDPVTGAPTIIGPTGQGPIAGLAWDETANVMYGVTGCSQQGPSKLVVVNLTTGSASVVGSTGKNLGSLEFAPNGLLYAGGDTNDGGNLYAISTVSGAATLVGPTGFTSVTGLTFASQALPVLVSHFDATPTVRGIDLHWSIAADEKVNGFRLYRRSGDESPVDITTQNGLITAAARSFVDEHVREGESYEYVLAVITDDREWLSMPARARALSGAFQLYQNTPNPFNPLTSIAFTLAERSAVALTIYDVHGAFVRRLEGGTLDAGRHAYVWDGKNAVGMSVSSGIYFYRLTSGKQSEMKKMVLLK